MTERPSAERLANLRVMLNARLDFAWEEARDVFRELDAVTRERDEARKEIERLNHVVRMRAGPRV